MTLTAPRITPLSTVLAGLATGLPDVSVPGTKESGPTGIESIIEYKGPVPILLNVVDWVDTFLVSNIDGLDGADLRQSATPNPGEDGETPGETLWGGRTLVMSGDLLARTVWKMRDMSAGIRGSFYSDVNTEYPLIFHALDPNNDLFISCKVNDKIRITDQQQAKGSSDRKWQISLRASNPRFLSVVQQSQSITSVLSYIDFKTINNIYIEDMTAQTLTGISAGYTETGDTLTAASGFLLPKAVAQNYVPNPQAKVNNNRISGFVNGGARAVTAESFGSIGPRGNTCAGLKGTGSAQPQTSTFEIRYMPDDAAPYRPFKAGDQLRVSGWLMQKQFPRNGPRTVSVYVRFYQGAVNSSVLFSSVNAGDLVPMAGDLDPDTGVPLVMQHQNSWYPFNFEVTVPSGVTAAWAAVGCVATGIADNSTMEFYGADMVLDFNRDPGTSIAQEFGDGDKAGWMWEYFGGLSASRRVFASANKIWDPSGRGINVSLNRPNSWQPGIGYDAAHLWQMITNDFSGIPYGRYLRMTGPTTAPGPSIGLWIATYPTITSPVTFIDVNAGQTYTFSFYSRTAATARNLSVKFDWNSIIAGGQGGFAPATTVALGAETSDNAWHRYSCTVVVPANVLSIAQITVAFTTSSGNLVAGEIHDVGAFMLTDGSVVKEFVDASNVINGDTAPTLYIDADSTMPNQSGVLGPLGDTNRVINGDFDSVGIFGFGQNSTLSLSAQGGVDNQQYMVSTYTGGAKPNFGFWQAYGAVVGIPSSFSCYARLGIPGVQRKFVIEVDHIGPGSVVIDAVDSGVVMLNDQWTLVTLEDVVPPVGTVDTRIYLIELEPVNGDILHIDKIIGSNTATVPSFFDGSSEFGEWPLTGIVDDTSNWSYRLGVQRAIPPRMFTECEQIVKFITDGARTTANEIHLALSYIDEDNQLYMAIDKSLNTKIVTRRNGTDSAFTHADLPVPLAAGTSYWFRAWLKAGCAGLDVSTDDPDNPGTPGTVLIKSLVFTQLSAIDTAFWQDTPHKMSMAVQERGGLWKIDEWRYRGLDDLTGWAYLKNGFVPVSDGDKIRPLMVGSQTVIVRSDLTSKVIDAVSSFKARVETLAAASPNEFGVGIKVLDSNNWIEGRIRTKWVGQSGTFHSLAIYKMDAGVPTELAFTTNTPMAVAIDNWVRVVMTGNVITAQRWLTDPTLGGAPTETTTFTLVGADAIKFGAGVKGQVGIVWSPANQTARIDDFRMTISSFNDIAYNLINKGTYKAQTTIKLTGPMTNPVITNSTTGESTVINGTIPSGETWIIQNSNNTKRFYRKSDGAPLYSHWDATSMWLHIAPNSIVNPIVFSATGLDAGWDLEVDYHHTYM